MTAEQLEAKVGQLSGDRLIGSLDEPDRPISDVLDLIVG
jgi:hypothetical protein